MGVSVSAAIVKSESMIAFASFWYGARAKTGIIPAKSDLPLRGLAAFMPNLLLYRMSEEGGAFCILFGTALTDVFGENLTGTYLEDSMATADAKARRKTFEAYYREHGEGVPFGRWASGTLNSRTGKIIEFESLAFPYIEPSDGSTRWMVHVLPLAELSYGDRLIPQFTEITVRMFQPEGPRPEWLMPHPSS